MSWTTMKNNEKERKSFIFDSTREYERWKNNEIDRRGLACLYNESMNNTYQWKDIKLFFHISDNDKW